ncbi:MAG: hypothetical protein EXS48_02595 [Candidatus Staskawiczbacteria bacterium]|nr:hypothetical protein [Candidatus Staskawiczbacteria bacterium]
MGKIILINGQGGAGKTSVSKELLKELKNSAYFDVDFLVATNPWEFGDATDNLAIKNAISLINNFFEKGFENIIVSGLTRNQKLLDKFTEQLNKGISILFIWLRANKETRLSRKEGRGRDDADKKEHFNFLDKLMPDVESIEVKNGRSIFIEISSKTIQEIVSEIKKVI